MAYTTYSNISFTKNKSIPVLLLIIYCALPFFPQNAFAQKTKPGEYQVKAAFLYNFMKFIDLPDEAFKDTSNITVCMIGEDPFEGNMELLRGKPVKNRAVTVKHIKAVHQATDCHVLYISPSEKENITQILKETEGRSLITIGDTEGFAQQGVIINFFLEQDMVRFEINTNAAKAAKIQISSKLLKLAKIIDGKEAGR